MKPKIYLKPRRQVVNEKEPPFPINDTERKIMQLMEDAVLVKFTTIDNVPVTEDPKEYIRRETGGLDAYVFVYETDGKYNTLLFSTHYLTKDIFDRVTSLYMRLLERINTLLGEIAPNWENMSLGFSEDLLTRIKKAGLCPYDPVNQQAIYEMTGFDIISRTYLNVKEDPNTQLRFIDLSDIYKQIIKLFYYAPDNPHEPLCLLGDRHIDDLLRIMIYSNEYNSAQKRWQQDEYVNRVFAPYRDYKRKMASEPISMGWTDDDEDYKYEDWRKKLV